MSRRHVDVVYFGGFPRLTRASADAISAWGRILLPDLDIPDREGNPHVEKLGVVVRRDSDGLWFVRHGRCEGGMGGDPCRAAAQETWFRSETLTYLCFACRSRK